MAKVAVPDKKQEHKRQEHKKQKNKKQEDKGGIKYFDYSMLAVLLFLICFGLVMLYSTSAYDALLKFNDDMYYFKRQLFFSGISIVVMWGISKIDYRFYAKIAKFSFLLAFFLMALVEFSPLGVNLNGALRWLAIPGIGMTFQPSEIMKVATILFIPILIAKKNTKKSEAWHMARVLLWGGAGAFGVYWLTDNLSTAIIVFGIVVIMLFITHSKTTPWILLALGATTALMVFVRFIGDMLETGGGFRMQRVLVWLNPEQYAEDRGFQVIQGLYAIGSGGFFGKGLGNSAQKMIIPEVQNDMILAIICEELGVFGAIIVLVLFGILLYRILIVAQNAPDLYGALLATGVFAHIALQVILNVAVVLNVIPTTGITLPFISYGGTSVIFLMAEMGIVLGISRKIKMET